MHIPSKLCNKVIRTFGTRGEQWLQEAPEIVQKCMTKWSLTDGSISDILSYNLIYFARSPLYGEVALKVGVPDKELVTEMTALSLYEGKNICKCYESDSALSAMLLERILPGGDLTTVRNHSERINIAANLVARLPITIEGEHGLPTFASWVSRAFQRARAEGRVGKKMLLFIDLAEELFSSINELHPHVLLHGDLNHWNILQDHDQWKAIDPKGAIGPRCLDSARFIQNELDFVTRASKPKRLDEMFAVFSQALGETKQTIARCFFIDTILSTCWSFEDNVLPETLKDRVDNCEIAWQEIARL